MSKKQNSISLSTAEAKYITTNSCCTQLLWMQKLLDYDIRQEHLTIYCDNNSAINISKNPIQHSWTKHIEIQHHFIWELVKDGTLTLEFIHTDDQKADLFTKPLDSKWFEFFRQNIGVISMDWSLLFLLLPHAFASSLCFTLFKMFLFVYFSVLLYFSFHKNKNKKIEKSEKYKKKCVLCVHWYLCTLDGHWNKVL